MPFLTKAICVDSNEWNWTKKAEQKTKKTKKDGDTGSKGQEENKGETLSCAKGFTTILSGPKVAVMRFCCLSVSQLSLERNNEL